MRKVVRLRRRGIPDAELLADLRRVATSLSKVSLSTREYDRAGRFRSGTIAARFGSWPAALSAADLEPASAEIESDEAMFENLLDVWTKLGRQPAFRDMRPPLSRWSGHQYDRWFGSWNNALTKFAQYVNAEIDVQEPANDGSRFQQRDLSRRTPRSPNLRMRWNVLQRDHFRCKCGRSPATDPSVILHVDHINAWSNGGESVLENLQTLCERCNLGKAAM